MGEAITAFQMLDLAIKSIAVVVPAGALCFAANQYSNAQKWKKHEFVASVWKEIETNPSVAKTMTMLDWNARHINLFEGEEDVLVTDESLVKALIPHTETDQDEFTYEQSAIRDCFDEFFESLVRINHFIEAQLFTADDVRVYVEYWLKILTSRSEGKPIETRLAIWKFITAYKYDGVRDLCDKLDIRTPDVPMIETTNTTPVKRKRKQDRGLFLRNLRAEILDRR